jgi:hypothetical protein
VTQRDLRWSSPLLRNGTDPGESRLKAMRTMNLELRPEPYRLDSITGTGST